MLIKILYVDDEPDLRDIVKYSLEMSNQLCVETAASGEEALLLLRNGEYKAIISDYQMYGMDGITLLKEVRQAFGPVPFILFTGKGREEVVVQALNNGADFYLQKGPDVTSMFAELENMVLHAFRRKEAETAVRISEERLELAMEASNDGLWDWHPEENQMFWNARSHQMLGYEADEIVPSFDTWMNFMHPDDKGRVTKAIQDYFSDVISTYEVDFRVKAKNGAWIWIQSRGKVVQRDHNGRPVRMIGTHSNINDRKLAEERLKESELRFRGLFDTMNSGVAIYEVRNDGSKGGDYVIKDFNQTALQIEGQAKENIVGRSLLDLRPKIDEYGLIPIFQQVWRTGVPAFYPAKVYKDEKFTNWYENRVFRLPSGEIVAIYDDVTEETMQKEALKDSEERWAFALDGSDQGVWDWNIATNVVFFSKRWKGMIGYNDGEMPNKYEEWWNRIHPDDRAGVSAQISTCIDGQSNIYHSEHRLQCKDTSYKWILARGKVTARSQEGKPLRIIGTHTDIDDIKQTELALRQANAKLNLLSSLTRHDLINKLMVVMGYVELLNKKSLDPDSEHYLDRMDKVLRSLHSEVKFTKDYQDLGLKEPQWQSLPKIMTELDSPVTLSSELTDISVYADPMLIKVFRNLLDNSMRHGERVTSIRVHAYVHEGVLKILWEDNGVGIPSDQKERVFQWGVGRNMGLGLFLIRQVLSITNMTIHETGEFGRGARFEIDVPAEAYRIGSAN